MAIDIYYTANGERRELSRLGNNQIPMYIHVTGASFAAAAGVDFDWTTHDLLVDYGNYYQSGVSTTHFQIPHEGFYHVSCSITLTPDVAETGDFLASLFNSTHTGFPSGGWSVNANPLPTATSQYGTISVVDYFNKGEYLALSVSGDNMVEPFTLDALLSIAAIV